MNEVIWLSGFLAGIAVMLWIPNLIKIIKGKYNV